MVEIFGSDRIAFINDTVFEVCQLFLVGAVAALSLLFSILVVSGTTDHRSINNTYFFSVEADAIMQTSTMKMMAMVDR